jgi:hypothetical protein
MTTTRHKISATRSGQCTGMEGENEHEITFAYAPGRPADLGTWPPTEAEAPEVQFVSIDPGAGDHGAFSDLAQKHLEDWARDWLDDNFDRAMDKAETERRSTP